MAGLGVIFILHVPLCGFERQQQLRIGLAELKWLR